MKTPLALLLLALSAGVSRADAPDARFEVHEWGVFHLPKRGPVQARSGEGLPSFVQKFLPRPEGECAREPVLHFWCPAPLKATVEVDFPDGWPSVAWPGAEEGSAREIRRKAVLDAMRTLRWEVEAHPKDAPEPLPLPEGHWMQAARKVGSARLRVGDAAEDFLFYEGGISYASPAEAAFPGPAETTANVTFKLPGNVAEAWALEVAKDPGTGKRGVVLARGRGQALLKPVSEEDLKAGLAGTLTEAGLTKLEAEALLAAWMPELLKDGRRLVHLLPREDYDRVLPIRIAPEPDVLIRVALVVKEL